VAHGDVAETVAILRQGRRDRAQARALRSGMTSMPLKQQSTGRLC
jgi:hypothetical protein